MRYPAAILAFLLIPSLTFASAFEPRTVQQGATVAIAIPGEGLSTVKGIYKDSEVLFFESEKNPEDLDPISRGEFLELMFTNSETSEEKIANPNGTSAKTDNFPDVSFPDVPPTHPYYENIKKAAALGIVHGYEDGLFRPDTTITRGQIAKVLVETFDPNPAASISISRNFTDIPPTHRFKTHIDRAVKAEYFQGYPDGYMRPDRDINFSEAETVIRRAAGPAKFAKLPARKFFKGYVGIHRHSELGTGDLQLLLTYKDGSKEQKNIPISVEGRWYPTVSFSMEKSKTDLFAEDDLAQTWEMINEAKSQPWPEQLWEGVFAMPTTGELTLGFGDKLVINGAHVGSHFGLDYANATGTPIYAPNNGIVTLAAATPSYGNVVVLDHGHNIFTMYLHNDKLTVAAGQNVTKGDQIATMGSTGISTGPHLHYTNFVGDIIVDSTEWLEKEF